MRSHPYREAGRRPAASEQAGATALSPDDVVLAIMLLLLGGLGIGIGVSTDRPVELSLGLLLIVLAAKVIRDAWRATGS